MFRCDNTHLFTNASTARGRLYQASLETQLVKRWTCSHPWPRPRFSLMQILMYVTRQSLRSAALRRNGPRLCVDIPATHKWPSISNPRNVDANAFDNVSTGSSLALTLAMSYHTDCTFRPTLSLALTNFSGVLMFDDRASSEKTSVRRAVGREDISPQRQAPVDFFKKRTSSMPPQPTGAILDLSRLYLCARQRWRLLIRHLRTQASSFHVTRDCQMSPISRGVDLHTKVQRY